MFRSTYNKTCIYPGRVKHVWIDVCLIAYISKLDVEAPLFYIACIKDRCVSIYIGFTLVRRAFRQDRGGGGYRRGLAAAYIALFALNYNCNIGSLRGHGR
jgi:hypothetical protein